MCEPIDSQVCRGDHTAKDIITKDMIEMLDVLKYNCFTFTIIYFVSKYITSTEQGATETIEISPTPK
jgi:uncharacterized protein YuzB (UPF0349 family)